MNASFIGELFKAIEGFSNLSGTAAGKISTPTGTFKERVSGEQKLVLREIKADGAGGVPGRVNGLKREPGKTPLFLGFKRIKIEF